jgi:hypothetical protein
MHNEAPGRATMAPRSTTEAGDTLMIDPCCVNINKLTDIAPWRPMDGLVPRPENGVDAMNEIAKK